MITKSGGPGPTAKGVRYIPLHENRCASVLASSGLSGRFQNICYLDQALCC